MWRAAVFFGLRSYMIEWVHHPHPSMLPINICFYWAIICKYIYAAITDRSICIHHAHCPMWPSCIYFYACGTHLSLRGHHTFIFMQLDFYAVIIHGFLPGPDSRSATSSQLLFKTFLCTRQSFAHHILRNHLASCSTQQFRPVKESHSAATHILCKCCT
jgi:hypothetical protein